MTDDDKVESMNQSMSRRHKAPIARRRRHAVDTTTRRPSGTALAGGGKSTTSSGIGTCFSFAKEQNITSQKHRPISMAGRRKWHLRPYDLVAFIPCIICVLFSGSACVFVDAQQDSLHSVYTQSTTESSGASEASVVVTPDTNARFLLLADNATNATTTDNTTIPTVDEKHNTTMVNSTESNSAANTTSTTTDSSGGDDNSTLSTTNNTATSTDDNATDTTTGAGDGNSTGADSSNGTVTNDTSSSGGGAGNSTANSNTTVPGVNTTDIYGCNVTSGEKWCESLQVCFEEWKTTCPTSASCASNDDCTLWGGGCGPYACECFALGVNETAPTECDPNPGGEPCACAGGCIQATCSDVLPACVNLTCTMVDIKVNVAETANETSPSSGDNSTVGTSNATESNGGGGGNETNAIDSNTTNTTSGGPVDCSDATNCLSCLGLEGCGAWTSLGTCLSSCSDAPMDDVGCYSASSEGIANQTIDQICTQDATDRQNEILCKDQMNCSSCVAIVLLGSINNSTCQWFMDVTACRPTCGMTGCGDLTCSEDPSINTTFPGENNATNLINETATTNTTDPGSSDDGDNNSTNASNVTDPSSGTTNGDDSLLLRRNFGDAENTIKLGKKAKIVEFPDGNGLLSLRLVALPRRRVVVTDKSPESRNISLPPSATGVTVECDFRLENRRRGLLFFSASIKFQVSTDSETLTKTVQAKRQLIRRTAHRRTQTYRRSIMPSNLPKNVNVRVMWIMYAVTNLSRRHRIKGSKKQKFFLKESRLHLNEGAPSVQNSILQEARTDDGNVFEHNDDGIHLRRSRMRPPLQR